jgi:hypothetical protein
MTLRRLVGYEAINLAAMLVLVAVLVEALFLLLTQQ